jgi:hypothetical protein
MVAVPAEFMVVEMLGVMVMLELREATEREAVVLGRRTPASENEKPLSLSKVEYVDVALSRRSWTK